MRGLMSTHELFAISMGCQEGVEGCRGIGTVERMLNGGCCLTLLKLRYVKSPLKENL